MENPDFESTNINTLWLKNIYENLKNLENIERTTREGCTSIMDYLQIPQEQRRFIIGDTQYKNLRFIVTEINLLLTDLTPVMKQDKLAEFRNQLSEIGKIINNRNLFIHEPVNRNNRVIVMELKPFFWDTLIFLTKMRVEIIQEIAHLLYVRKGDSIIESYATIDNSENLIKSNPHLNSNG